MTAAMAMNAPGVIGPASSVRPVRGGNQFVTLH